MKKKEKENRSFTGDPGLSMNHAITQKHYSYESWLRIWNPELFLFRTRGRFSSPFLWNRGHRRRHNYMAGFRILLESAGGSGEPVGGLASASRGHARPWPWPAAASSGRSLSWGGLAMAVFAVHAPRDMRGSSERGRLNEGVERRVRRVRRPLWGVQGLRMRSRGGRQWWGALCAWWTRP